MDTFDTDLPDHDDAHPVDHDLADHDAHDPVGDEAAHHEPGEVAAEEPQLGARGMDLETGRELDLAKPGLSTVVPGYSEAPENLPFEPVDPATVQVDPAADGMHGEPNQDADYWLYQGNAGTCAPTSVAMVVADIAGIPLPSNEEVVDRALEMGLITYDPSESDPNLAWSGMVDVDIVTLIESYGVDVTLSYDNTLDDLCTALDNGQAVMIGVDAYEVWYGVDNDDEDGGQGVNHELVVTGVDTEAGLVYLNDSADPEGAGVVIPLDQFMDAWADDNYGMITTDLPEDQAADTLQYPGDGSPVAASGSDSGWADAVEQIVLLPFTFVVRLADRVF